MFEGNKKRGLKQKGDETKEACLLQVMPFQAIVFMSTLKTILVKNEKKTLLKKTIFSCHPFVNFTRKRS